MKSNVFLFIKSKNTVLFKKKVTERYDDTIKERNTIHEVFILLLNIYLVILLINFYLVDFSQDTQVCDLSLNMIPVYFAMSSSISVHLMLNIICYSFYVKYIDYLA